MRHLSPYERRSLDALDDALTHVPGYAAWRAWDPGPRVPLEARYAALPVLTKRDLRAHFPNGFVRTGQDLQQGLARGEVEYAQTSGSTDDQVTLVFYAPWWEASERAAWQLNAHAMCVTTGTHREVVLASPRCVGPGYSERALSMQERTLGRHLYVNQKINPATWTDTDLRRMADEINRFEPVVLEGDPAYLGYFARKLADMRLAVSQPALITLTYSYPSRLYLRQIRRAFQAPIVSSYGSTETGHVFMECEAGRLHQNAEHCRVDFEPCQPQYGGPTLGRMLVTVFHNPWFAVLRFDIGDVARLDVRGPCPCGRHEGLTLAAIEGRIKDVTFTPDGHPVTVEALDMALSTVEGLHGYQVDNARPGVYRWRALADNAQGASVVATGTPVLQRIYGTEARIEAEVVAALQHEPSGKFRFTHTGFPVDHDVLWRKGSHQMVSNA
jgi:phenylacetate-CoA ligase